jgi:hypothetical protein
VAETEVAFKFVEDGVEIWLTNGPHRKVIYMVGHNRAASAYPDKTFYQALKDNFAEAEAAAEILSNYSHLDESDPKQSEDGLCGQCGLPAADNDYLCSKCRLAA